MVLPPYHHPQLGGTTCTLGPHGRAAGPAKKIEGVEPQPIPQVHVCRVHPPPVRRRRDHSSLGVVVEEEESNLINLGGGGGVYYQR